MEAEFKLLVDAVLEREQYGQLCPQTKRALIKAKGEKEDEGELTFYLFYGERKPDTFKFQYKNEYHTHNCLTGYMMMGDEQGNVPKLVVATLNGEYYAHATHELSK